MPKSLLEQLPDIVADGRKQAQKILENIECGHRVALQTREAVLAAPGDVRASADAWTNRLIHGDNLLAMAALLAGDESTPSLRGKIDLIYIDPPFDSKADYRTKVRLPGAEVEHRPTVIEQFAYSDTWSRGTASYLAMITPRLILMRELLADAGSIYVHLDWHVGHYAKIVMDEVFGRDNFVNEIVWQRTGAHNDANRFGNVHDQIFLFGKTGLRHFTPTHTPYDKEYVDQRFRSVEPDTGRRFWLNTATAPGAGPARTFNGKLRHPPAGTHWRFSQETIDELIATGRIVFSTTGMPYVKQYLDESPGRPVQSVWSDIRMTKSGPERLDYATQKPEALLERIVRSSCPPGGLVADFNGGCGTTAAIAEKLGCRWVTTDLGKSACMITRKRLIDQQARPFLYQAIGDYHVESARAALGRDFCIGELAHIVLSLYGAQALPPEQNPQRDLGQIAGTGTLVLADSPYRLTGPATLRKAIEHRDGLMGGWQRVVVLGWHFEPAIGETIAALNDSRLQVLVIPPDLLDRLRKKGSLEKLLGHVRFSSLQYLTLHPIEREATARGQEALTVRLKNYVLLSPEAINLDETNRSRLQTVIDKEPLALIEYWAVDPDYDGRVFRSAWQDHRGKCDDDPLRVTTQARIALPAAAGARQVCVRAVDAFGFEAEVVSTVARA
jgi:adenine-specific DNA-methyltransferase